MPRFGEESWNSEVKLRRTGERRALTTECQDLRNSCIVARCLKFHNAVAAAVEGEYMPRIGEAAGDRMPPLIGVPICSG